MKSNPFSPNFDLKASSLLISSLLETPPTLATHSNIRSSPSFTSSWGEEEEEEDDVVGEVVKDDDLILS